MVELDLSKHATKSDFRWKSGFSYDIDKLEITPIDLSKLSHVIKNDVKKSAFDKLVKKVNAIDSNTKSWKKSLKMLVNNAWCQ